MSHNKKTITIITAVVLVLALVIGWCAWRKHVTSTKETQASANTSSSSSTNKAKKKKTPVLSDKQKEQNKTIALQMEKDMRNWGVDSLADPHQWAKQPADQVLAALRTPDNITAPADMPSSMKMNQSWGSNAPSYVCNTSDYQSLCDTMPTSQAWWKNEVWGTGTRWVKDPTAKVYDDGKVRVKGKVRTILVTSGDTYSEGDYNALTPAWRDYQIDDLLTIENGKVSDIEYEGAQYWWINPFLSQWTPDKVADSLGYGTRIAIPVSGGLNWNGMNPTGITRVLNAPESKGDLDGKVDWSMWDDVSFSSNTGCQNCPAS
jgi:hypothetical protein